MNDECAGQKRQLRWLRHYLASVTTSILPRAVTSTALHVYDLRNKLVAANVTLPQVSPQECTTHGLTLVGPNI